MTLSLKRVRALIVLCLAALLGSSFNLRSLAAGDARQQVEGNVSGTSREERSASITVFGRVKVNGNQVQSGTTVFSGSKISTSPGSHAALDLGRMGRIELSQNTAITLMLSTAAVQVQTHCAATHVDVTRGEVQVHTPVSRTIGTGEANVFDGAVDLASGGNADFRLGCNDSFDDDRWRGPGLVGVLGMVGVGVGVALGIHLGDRRRGPPPGIPPVPPVPPVSPFQP